VIPGARDDLVTEEVLSNLLVQAHLIDKIHTHEALLQFVNDVNLILPKGSLVVYKVDKAGVTEVQINLKDLFVKSSKLKAPKEYTWNNDHGKKIVTAAYVKKAMQHIMAELAKKPGNFVSREVFKTKAAKTLSLNAIRTDKGKDTNLYKTLEIEIDTDIDQEDRIVTFISVVDQTWDEVTVQDGVAEVVYNVCTLHGANTVIAK
jgi:hypothetical protein